MCTNCNGLILVVRACAASSAPNESTQPPKCIQLLTIQIFYSQTGGCVSEHQPSLNDELLLYSFVCVNIWNSTFYSHQNLFFLLFA